jgi:hypothetical protein
MSEPRGGAAIPYARRPDERDDLLSMAQVPRSEKTDRATVERIVDTIYRLFMAYGAAETLRLLTTLLQDAEDAGREPFAGARTFYGSSLSGTGAADRRPPDSAGFAQRFPDALKIRIS